MATKTLPVRLSAGYCQVTTTTQGGHLRPPTVEWCGMPTTRLRSAMVNVLPKERLPAGAAIMYQKCASWYILSLLTSSTTCITMSTMERTLRWNGLSDGSLAQHICEVACASALDALSRGLLDLPHRNDFAECPTTSTPFENDWS